ncbi:MAG TPA: ACP phosphodiesterase [Burkholderiales bacterium]|nr:ACP phosphodiesterase [Burkholderiales bacterium]
MNYLAHLYLAEPDDDGWLGALMGDFVKGPLDASRGDALTRAIALHRAIDTYTDAHPVVLRSKARVSTGRRRFAGVMVDLFYDHFLARHWREYHDEPLERFSARVYGILLDRLDALPERLQRIAPSMARTDWLGSYAEIGSVRVALDNMGRRLRRENALRGSADELVANYAALESDFREFFPELSAFARHRHAGAAAGSGVSNGSRE